ncbi:hypothetical protein ACEQ8H_006334 [Pleosporales sp. CAS-2024a]
MATLENESAKLPDGRTLSYAIYGSPMPRKTVIYMHGFPSSRFEGKIWHSACIRHGVRLVVPDRPGSGSSTFQKARTMLDWPADVIALADQLKVHAFYVLGVSGGGPYALVCLKSIPKERLVGVAVVSGICPLKLGTAGMPMPTRFLFWAAPWATRLTGFFFDATMAKAARNKDASVLENLMRNQLFKRHPGDVLAMKDAVHWPIMVAMTRASFAKSGQGAAREATLYGSDWGFELDQLVAKTDAISLKLWHGTADLNVPVTMARKAHDLVSGSVLHLKEGDGHMDYVFRDAHEILSDLVQEEETDEYVTVSSPISV